MPDLYSLLAEPLLGVRLPGGKRTRMTLPGLLAQLSGDGVEAYTALQAHQAQAWHSFLVQLAAMALLEGGKSKPPKRPGDWNNLLLELSGGSEEAWRLVVGDLRKPAFLQPPVPERKLTGFKTELTTPDALDVLITAKNHDVKMQRMDRAAPEHWTYALVSLQTTQGFSGRGNYGIARMNGGAGSRPMVGLVPSDDPGPRFRRDLDVLVECQDSIAAEHGYLSDKKLLWLEPWDGTKAIPLRKLHPYSIEICRRIRLVAADDRVSAMFAPSIISRVESKDRQGDVGDPWTPVNTAAKKSLTIGARGFTYQLTQALLFAADYRPPPTQQLLKSDPEDLLFHASALARGMGTTSGLHERLVAIPPKIRPRLAIAGERNRLATMAKARVDAAAASRKVLKPALLVLLQSAPEKLNLDDDRCAPWLGRLDKEIDRVFFEQLWEDADLPSEDARKHWERALLEMARVVLEEAMREAPVAAARKYRAQAAAERVFFGSARKHLPDAFSEIESEPKSHEAKS